MAVPETQEPEEKCDICKKDEMTGAVFLIRLRTAKEKERNIPSVRTCDGCSNLVDQLLRSPGILEKLIKELAN